MKKDILVVKYGSSSVSSADGLDFEKISIYAEKINKLADKYHIVIVSSGSVTSGKSLSSDVSIDSAALFAMMGSATIVTAWQQALMKHDLLSGQILVTHNDFTDKEEGGMLRRIIHDAITHGIIPIVNENDVLSDIELAKLSYGGDNDGLAATVSMAIGAKYLLLLTNVDGLLDENRQVISSFSIDEHNEMLKLANGKSDSGRGGMESKLNAGVQATKKGVKVVIGNSNADYQDLLCSLIGTTITV